MTPAEGATSRADLHCHSTASQVSKLGIQRSAGLPECATPPEEVYELAKRRGMDFVTITDHDTIDGALAIAEHPDAFISEELTASFRGEPQAVHVLCYGITPADHEWLQGHAVDLEECAEYLHGNSITCALAHPFYAVAAPLEPRHRRRLAELFGIWEVRNGSRARELNMPAAIYVDTRGGTGVGGSDDHAGVDIGRTFTETPIAVTPEEYLALIRSGQAEARGEQGSASKWAHAAIAIATRSLLADPEACGPAPDAVLRLIQRVVGEGAERTGTEGADFTAADAAALLNAWLTSVGLPHGRELIELMKADDFSHRDLFRRSRAIHDGRLREVTALIREEIAGSDPSSGVLTELFDACLPVVPYLPAATFLANERARLVNREGEQRRVALVVDGVDVPHGVTHTIERIRELGVPGFEVEVVGTDRGVDRRLPAAAEMEVPFYEGLTLGVPSLPGLLETLAEGRFDLIHVATPGPTGVAAALTARIAGIPLLASHHTEFVSYARMRSGSESLAAAMAFAMALFYRECGIVLSPSRSADDSLAELGVPPAAIARWVRGVDTTRFSPDRRRRNVADGRISVLYAGRQTREKGVDLLADAFLIARAREPRLHLVLAGGGPEEGYLRERLGDTAEFRGWLGGDDLAAAYADADAFLFPSRTDTYGQVVVEAQASGVPVVAIRAGGPADLIDDWRTGLLCEPDAKEMAAKLLRIAEVPALRDRLIRGGIAAAAERTWSRALGQLAEGYGLALGEGEAPAGDAPVERPRGPRVPTAA
jgi:glycosyltransferase involved in cell wall biosynthesis/predicted metal-dependent phosphoesterase TrpH